MKQRPVEDKGKIRVFVYGTLKLQQPNNILLEKANSEFIGHDSIVGQYALHDLGGFPAVVDKTENKDKVIKGQIFCTNEEGLAALDHLEGHPNFYCRRKVWTTHRHKRAWVYFLHNDTWLNKKSDITTHEIWNPSDLELAYWSANNPKEEYAQK